MKRLYLLRHAKADNSQDDYARALSERGVLEAKNLARYITANGFMPDLAVASPAMRTRQTLELVAENANFKCLFRFPQRLYLASTGTILSEINKIEDSFTSLLVVCHNSGIQELAALLCEDAHSPHAAAIASSFPPCSMAAYDFPVESWKMVELYSGDIIDYVNPKILSTV